MQAMPYNDATPLEIRSPHHDIDGRLRQWVHERLGRHLGKFASQIERIDVRFGDENGPKGGVDRDCLVHVILHSLSPIAVEARGETDREAFDLAAGRAERAIKHALQKSGFSTKHKRRHRGSPSEMPATNGSEPMESRMDGMDGIDGQTAELEDSLYGRREGRGATQLAAALERPDAHTKASQPGIEHTARRNSKQNTAGMVYDLEDSMTGRPSRKSTRHGKNRVKPASGLTLRTKRSMHSPGAVAARAGRAR